MKDSPTIAFLLILGICLGTGAAAYLIFPSGLLTTAFSDLTVLDVLRALVASFFALVAWCAFRQLLAGNK